MNSLSGDSTSVVTWSTWWELPPSATTRSTTATDKAGSFSNSGAVRLLQRCQTEYGWDFVSAKRIVMAYKDFLQAISFLPTSDHWLVPCPLVHQIWQLHVCDTQHYANDCNLLMGRIVHYNHYLEEEYLKSDMDDHSEENHHPSVDEEESVQDSYMRRRKHKRQLIQKTIKFICEKTNQEQLDTQVWHYGSTSMSHPAFVNDIVPTKPCTLKRDGPSSSFNNNDDQSRVEETNGGSRRKKKMRLNDSRSHPWDHSTLQTSSNTNSSNNNNNNNKKKQATSISVQIQFTSNSKHDLLKKTNKNQAEIAGGANDAENNADDNDDKENKENNPSSNQKADSDKLQTTFDLEQDAPLHHIFQQVATAHDLDRQCLQFTYRGQILEGDETPLNMSKYHGSSSKENDDDCGDTGHNKIAKGGLPPLDQHQSAALGMVLLKIRCSPVLPEC
ncbi:MAG: hypothetical protein SGBAC_012990 [Bacillariaceae sp.]